MKKLPLFAAQFVMLLVVSLTGAQTPAPTPRPRPLPASDQQFWNDTHVRVALTQRLALNFQQVTRFGTEVTFRSDTRSGLGLLVRLNKYYSIQPAYQYQYAHPGDGRKNYSHRLSLDNLFRFTAGKVVFPFRGRVDRNWRQGNTDFWYVRLRPGIEVPVHWGKERVTLFASNESFYDTRFHAWSRQRMMVGVSRRLSPVFTGEFYYLQQFDQRATPGNLKVFGTTFRFQFHQEK